MEKMENHKNHIVWKLQQILLNRINIKKPEIILNSKIIQS